MSNPQLARVAATSVAVFAAASVLAAVGYAEWMWLFVFLGLVVPPVVLVATGVMALGNRLSGAGPARRR